MVRGNTLRVAPVTANMKILGVGELARSMDMAIAHAVQLDAIDGFTIGFTSSAQLTQVTGKIAQVAI